MDPASPFPFTELPPELQEHVTLTTPNMLFTMSQVSTEQRDLLAPKYAALCQGKPVTKTEALRYARQKLGKLGNKFVLLLSSPPYDSFYKFRASIIDICPDNLNRLKYLHTIIVNWTKTVSDNFADAATLQNLQAHNISLPDFLLVRYGPIIDYGIITADGLNQFLGATEYPVISAELGFLEQRDIFAQRQQCVRIIPQYAQKRIVAALQYLRARSDNGDFITILCVAARLAVELKVINIPLDVLMNSSFSDTLFTKSGIKVLSGENYSAMFRISNSLAVDRLTEYYTQ